jgi:hypothetical protein
MVEDREKRQFRLKGPGGEIDLLAILLGYLSVLWKEF